VLSNRADDRVVLWERDPRHPGGEAFVGGSGPDLVARTPEVERLLRAGLLLEIPEPPDGRKKPTTDYEALPEERTDQPGQPIRLGRELDPELVPEGAQRKVLAQQEDAPEQVDVPAGTVVPPAPEPERSTSRR
jgi:hypothetical protein